MVDCQICGKSKTTADSGSMTQWISRCNCKTIDVGANDGFATCASCGKRINPGRQGSLTQWIFHGNFCSCAQPLPNKESAERVSATTDEATPSQEEAELQVDSASFPLDRYKPLSIVGEGANGTVYLCRDRLLNKKIAVKILKSVDAAQLVTFQKEAKTTARLNHPNIVRILDFGATDSTYPYMVMEYVKGQTLKQIVDQSGPFDPFDALKIFEQVADALAYAHENKIFHRDLQPSNIVYSKDSSGEIDVRILDFGLAQLKHETQEPTFIDGKAIVGTPFYMSPDQVNGFSYDARSEIYSLGCCLYDAVIGTPPFVGATALETIGMHAHDELPSLLDAFSDERLAASLDELISRCTAKVPDDRFRSMEELSRSIRSIANTTSFDGVHEATSSSRDNRVETRFDLKTLGLGAAAFFAISLIVMWFSKYLFQQSYIGDGKLPLYEQPSTWVREQDEFKAPHAIQAPPNELRGRSLTIWNFNDRVDIEKIDGVKDVVVRTGDSTKLEDIKPLTRLRSMSTLDINDLTLEKSELKEFYSKVKNLAALYVTNTIHLDDEILSLIIKNNPHLETLRINYCPITSNGLKQLRDLKNLRTLGVYGLPLTMENLNTLPQGFRGLLFTDNDELTVDKISSFVQKRKSLEYLHVATAPKRKPDDTFEKYEPLSLRFPKIIWKIQ